MAPQRSSVMPSSMTIALLGCIALIALPSSALVSAACPAATPCAQISATINGVATTFYCCGNSFGLTGSGSTSLLYCSNPASDGVTTSPFSDSTCTTKTTPTTTTSPASTPTPTPGSAPSTAAPSLWILALLLSVVMFSARILA